MIPAFVKSNIVNMLLVITFTYVVNLLLLGYLFEIINYFLTVKVTFSLWDKDFLVKTKQIRLKINLKSNVVGELQGELIVEFLMNHGHEDGWKSDQQVPIKFVHLTEKANVMEGLIQKLALEQWNSQLFMCWFIYLFLSPRTNFCSTSNFVQYDGIFFNKLYIH